MIDLNRFDDTPPFSIFRPVMEFIDEGKHISIIYNIIHFAMALLNLILPFVILYKAANLGFFKYGAKFVFAFILLWLVVVIVCWIGFQIWWQRRKRETMGSPEFMAMPAFSYLLQTGGECIGIQLSVFGFLGGLVGVLFFGRDVVYFLNMIGGTIGLNFMRYGLRFGVLVILMGPIIGIAIMLISRFFAETIRVFAAIANR